MVSTWQLLKANVCSILFAPTHNEQAVCLYNNMAITIQQKTQKFNTKADKSNFSFLPHTSYCCTGLGHSMERVKLKN